MRAIMRRGVVCFAIGLYLGGAAAEESHGEEPHYVTHGRNHLSIFTGATNVDEEGTEFTLGIDYEYRVNDVLGVGTVVEHAFGEIDATTIVAVADIHPAHGAFIIQLGPGVEFRHDEEIFVVRAGALYEFEHGPYTISPQIHYDYHEGHEDAIVFGLAFGVSF